MLSVGDVYAQQNILCPEVHFPPRWRWTWSPWVGAGSPTYIRVVASVNSICGRPFWVSVTICCGTFTVSYIAWNKMKDQKVNSDITLWYSLNIFWYIHGHMISIHLAIRWLKHNSWIRSARCTLESQLWYIFLRRIVLANPIQALGNDLSICPLNTWFVYIVASGDCILMVTGPILKCSAKIESWNQFNCS